MTISPAAPSLGYTCSSETLLNPPVRLWEWQLNIFFMFYNLRLHSLLTNTQTDTLTSTQAKFPAHLHLRQQSKCFLLAGISNLRLKCFSGCPKQIKLSKFGRGEICDKIWLNFPPSLNSCLGDCLLCRIHPTSIGMAQRKGRSREGEGNGHPLYRSIT